jgi:DNA-binding MarR family transcriptional regulator
MILSDRQATAWHAMLTANGRVTTRVDAELVEGADMTLAEYEVLHHLAAADDGRLRMNELADRARLSPSGLTRRFDSLVRRGWVLRERCDDDRRGVFARLTDAGRDRYEAARPVHDRAVRDHFFAHLSAEDLDCMTRVMAVVAEANTPRPVTRP